MGYVGRGKKRRWESFYNAYVYAGDQGCSREVKIAA
jgi:hypothetical protein